MIITILRILGFLISLAFFLFGFFALIIVNNIGGFPIMLIGIAIYAVTEKIFE
jgi:hypothetical protein